jgi:hypothetical protein
MWNYIRKPYELKIIINMIWINILHCYQPANSDAYKIKEAADLSYKKIV